MNVSKIADAIEGVLPERRPIAHHEPSINGKEKAFVNECLDRGIVGDQWVKRAESMLAGYCGTQYAVGVGSGTAALHLALLAAGINPGEEVIVPTLTFVATANAVRYAGAVPNFVDGALGINAYKLRRYLENTSTPNKDGRGRINNKTGRVISALIVVDLLGFPADMPKLSALAEGFNLIMIEDSAQALGSSIGNQRCGSFGTASIFSFNNNKIVTGNGGGMLLTNDEWVAAKAWQLATTAKVPHAYKMEHDALAFNYRMGNLSAAVVCAQLERLEEFLDAKKVLLARYKEALAPFGEVELLTAKEHWHGSPNYWLVTMLIKPQFSSYRDKLLDELHNRGIQARALFTPLHKLSMFADCPRGDNLAYAEQTVDQAVCLPSGVGLV